jgi:hypothetical protein
LGWCGSSFQHCGCKSCMSYFAATKVKLLAPGRECVKPAAELGIPRDLSDMTLVRACAELAFVTARCGRRIMVASSNACRCCAVGEAAVGPVNAEWKTYEFEV